LDQLHSSRQWRFKTKWQLTERANKQLSGRPPAVIKVLSGTPDADWKRLLADFADSLSETPVGYVALVERTAKDSMKIQARTGWAKTLREAGRCEKSFEGSHKDRACSWCWSCACGAFLLQFCPCRIIGCNASARISIHSRLEAVFESAKRREFDTKIGGEAANKDFVDGMLL
jgi:hypothetical protein